MEGLSTIEEPIKPKKKIKRAKKTNAKCSLVTEASIDASLDTAALLKGPEGQPFGRLQSSFVDSSESADDGFASASPVPSPRPSPELAPSACRQEPGDKSALDYMRKWTESLDQWTAGQKTAIDQIFAKQGRVEAMVEQLLQNSLCVIANGQMVGHEAKALTAQNQQMSGHHGAAEDKYCTGHKFEMSSAMGQRKQVGIEQEVDEVSKKIPSFEGKDYSSSQDSVDCGEFKSWSLSKHEEIKKGTSKVGFATNSQGGLQVSKSSNKWSASVALAAPESPTSQSKPRRTSRETRASLGRLHSVFVQAIWNIRADDMDHHHAKSWWLHQIEELVEHPLFEYFSACLIFSHSFFIGVYVEYTASTGKEVPVIFKVLNGVFTVGFVFEVTLKALGERIRFFFGHEWAWNAFDCLLLTTIVFEIVYGISIAGKDAKEKKKMKTALKLAEMARTMRILRILKVLKFSATLRMLLTKMFASIAILLWVIALLSLIMFVVAVCMTQAYNDVLLGRQHEVGYEDLNANQKGMDHYFGSIPRSCYTIVAAVCFGLEWDKAFSVLVEASIFYAAIFMFFLVLTVFVGMNILTGVFVDNAMSCNSDIGLELAESNRKRQADHLKDMFQKMDRDHSEILTLDEFLGLADRPELETYLAAVNISSSEASTLFHLLDEDGSGEMSIEEFVFGCMHLRGEARSLDMKTLLYENRRLRHKVFKHISASEDMLTEILARIDMRTTAEARRNQMQMPAAKAALVKKGL